MPPASVGPPAWLETLSRHLNQAMAWFGGLILAGLMFFVVFDVAMRALGWPVAGSFEIIGWLSASAMSLALGYVQICRGHVAVTLLTDHVGERTRNLLELVIGVLALTMFVVVAWFVGRYGQTLQESGSLSETLRIVVYPWVYVVAIGFAGLALALLVDVVQSLHRIAAGAR
jgi:TRAP-type C4-dicarboxylate transport system permease small subunit